LIFEERHCKVLVRGALKSCNFVLRRRDETEGKAAGQRVGGTVSLEAESIINLRHELVRLGELIDWARLEAHFAPYYREAGRPGLPIRLVVDRPDLLIQEK
jgi:hypothetical protein